MWAFTHSLWTMRRILLYLSAGYCNIQNTIICSHSMQSFSSSKMERITILMVPSSFRWLSHWREALAIHSLAEYLARVIVVLITFPCVRQRACLFAVVLVRLNLYQRSLVHSIWFSQGLCDAHFFAITTASITQLCAPQESPYHHVVFGLQHLERIFLSGT